jgi:NAD(P)H-flavin reductase
MGTGVAPLRAMVQERVNRKSLSGVALLQGARVESELLLRDEFNANVEQGLDYRPVLSQPTGQWMARTGRVQRHLDDLDMRARFRVCGSKAMVGDVTERLLQRGALPEQIDGEGY